MTLKEQVAEKKFTLRANNLRELLADYGSEVMVLARKNKKGELAKLTDEAYTEALNLILSKFKEIVGEMTIIDNHNIPRASCFECKLKFGETVYIKPNLESQLHHSQQEILGRINEL